jgi:predicted DNA-binding transcriptional regulator AlpA
MHPNEYRGLIDNSEYRIVTQFEAADFLRISTRTIDRLCLSGELKRIQISPRRVGFLEADLLAFAQRKREAA